MGIFDLFITGKDDLDQHKAEIERIIEQNPMEIKRLPNAWTEEQQREQLDRLFDGLPNDPHFNGLLVQQIKALAHCGHASIYQDYFPKLYARVEAYERTSKAK